MGRNGKELEPLKSLGGSNFRKGKYLRLESNSQRRGRGFDSHLLHQHSRYQIFGDADPHSFYFQLRKSENFFLSASSI